MKNLKVGIIGFGNIGSAIGNRWAHQQGIEVMASNKEKFSAPGIITTTDNVELSKSSDIVFIAVKQKDMATVAHQIAPYVKGKLVISLMAGITLDHLDQILKSRNARLMTNVSFVDGAAISAYCMDQRCAQEDKETMEVLLKHGSKQILHLKEDQMNKITVASSCSLGFMAETFDYFEKAFIKMGFDEATAKQLVNNSIEGTLALSRSSSFGSIAEKVSSKGGMTVAGMTVMRNWKTDQILESTIEAAEKRGDEISLTNTSAIKRTHVSNRDGMEGVKTVVVKIGTTNIVNDNLAIDMVKLARLVEGIINIKRAGKKVVLVTSGAVGSGRGRLGMVKSEHQHMKKAAASVGQVLLMHAYEELFRKQGQTVGQMLLTSGDFEDKESFDEFISTMHTLLYDFDVIPIVNENDVITNQETTFSENDMLSAKIATGIMADLVVILSDVDGLYTADPRSNPSSKLIGETDEIEKAVSFAGGAQKGTGGMRSKMRAVNLLLSKNIGVVIANGSREHVLESILNGEDIGTFFRYNDENNRKG